MESEQVCRMLLQELRRHEVARCREHSQVITYYLIVRLFLIYFNLNQHCRMKQYWPKNTILKDYRHMMYDMPFLSARGPARSGYGRQGGKGGSHSCCDPDRGVVQSEDVRSEFDLS